MDIKEAKCLHHNEHWTLYQKTNKKPNEIHDSWVQILLRVGLSWSYIENALYLRKYFPLLLNINWSQNVYMIIMGNEPSIKSNFKRMVCVWWGTSRCTVTCLSCGELIFCIFSYAGENPVTWYKSCWSHFGCQKQVSWPENTKIVCLL